MAMMPRSKAKGAIALTEAPEALCCAPKALTQVSGRTLS